ncbi:hypothetical protein SD71_12745 [Cohnella kolymensis]|uniref:Yip1 domain-containing protein n=1 Tax=Cohnella kolymensis TaxID=1590652 RepID=A0ABR5A3H6_9BACL|nr:hypothetical protein [Cohnella kolymensis]KIL35608.1 hypothetical protein SD71_12745 [Cohnella kolymensis]
MSEQEPFDNKPAFEPVREPNAPLKHSGFGIASFIMGIVGILGLIIVTTVIVSLVSSTLDLSTLVDPNGNPTMTEEEIIAAVTPILPYIILFPLFIVIHFIGLILGIIGLARAGYRKMFAIIGTILNGMVLLLVLLLLIIGLAAGMSAP